MWLAFQFCPGTCSSWHDDGMWNALSSLPLYGLASTGRPSEPSLNPSPRFSIPKWSSYEWFSIISTTMCSICGSVSVPSAIVGLGSEPGLRITCGRVVGVDDGEPPCGAGWWSGNPTSSSPTTSTPTSAAPAASAPIPFSIERRLNAPARDPARRADVRPRHLAKRPRARRAVYYLGTAVPAGNRCRPRPTCSNGVRGVVRALQQVPDAAVGHVRRELPALRPAGRARADPRA